MPPGGAPKTRRHASNTHNNKPFRQEQQQQLQQPQQQQQQQQLASSLSGSSVPNAEPQITSRPYSEADGDKRQTDSSNKQPTSSADKQQLQQQQQQANSSSRSKQQTTGAREEMLGGPMHSIQRSADGAAGVYTPQQRQQTDAAEGRHPEDEEYTNDCTTPLLNTATAAAATAAAATTTPTTAAATAYSAPPLSSAVVASPSAAAERVHAAAFVSDVAAPALLSSSGVRTPQMYTTGANKDARSPAEGAAVSLTVSCSSSPSSSNSSSSSSSSSMQQRSRESSACGVSAADASDSPSSSSSSSLRLSFLFSFFSVSVCSSLGVQIFRAMISVLLAWAQEPLLSFFVSAAAARLKEGASLAVSAAGAGSQLPDGLCLLLAALGVAMTSICSSSKHAAAPAAAAAADAEEEDEEAAAAPTIATVKQQQQQQQQQQTFTAPLCPFRSAAVGVWLASVLGLGLTICLYFGAEDILSFFLSIKTAAAAAGGLQQQQQQQDTLSLAFKFVRVRCLSLPFCVVAMAARGALLGVGDAAPQMLTAAAAVAAAPALFFFSTRAAAAAAAAADGATAGAAAAAAVDAFIEAAAGTVVTVQIVVALLLLLRLAVLAAAAASPAAVGGCSEHAEQQQQQPQQQQQKLLRGLRFFSVLYRAPSAAEVSLFGPFLMPILTQCCVRLMLYSSMTKAASLWGPKGMAAHQLVAGLYTVIGMPSDALAQIINAAMARRSFEFNSNDKQTKINKRKQIRKYIFQIAAVTAGISAAAQLAACAFFGGRLNAADPSLAFAVKVSGVCSAIALLFVPFASALEGILLIEMRWLRIAAAYSLTLPASLIAFVVAGCIDSFHKRKSLYFLQETQFVCLLWLLPLIYNVIKIAVMQIEHKKKQNIQTKQQDNIMKTAAANEDIL